MGESGSRINITFLNVDIEYNEYWCGGYNCGEFGNPCTWDYVEMFGERFCGWWSWRNGTWGPHCSDEVVRFSSDDYDSWNNGFRAEWIEVPDDGESVLHILNQLYCVSCRQASRVAVFRLQ